MTRAAVLAGLLWLAACHRSPAELAPSADADAQRATAAKTLADVAAAEEASRRPLDPVDAPAAHARAIATATRAPVREEAPSPSPANDTPVEPPPPTQ